MFNRRYQAIIAKNLLLENTCKNCFNTDIGRQVASSGFATTGGCGFECLLKKNQKHNTCEEWRHM